MMMLVKYFWMYLLLGMICNLCWGMINSFTILRKCNGDMDLYREAIGVWLNGDTEPFDRMVNTLSKAILKEKYNPDKRRKSSTLSASELLYAFVRSTFIWPANIAYGVARLQDTLNWIENHTNTKSS